jgi:hypothetical protein
VFFEAVQVRLQQVKCSFGIRRIDARSPQADYAAFLLLYEATALGDEFLGATKIVFGSHFPNNAQGGEKGGQRSPLRARIATNIANAGPAATWD